MPTANDIGQVLRRYPFELDSNNIEPIETGFSEAHVWRVDGFALRCWHAAMNADRLRHIHRLLCHISEAGITQVPKPLSSRSGDSVVVDSKNQLWQLEPWMPGVASFLENPTESRRRSVFQTLGRWHNESSRFGHAQSHKLFGYTNQPCETLRLRSQMIKSQAESLAQIESGLANESDSRFRQLGGQIANAFRRLHRQIADELHTVAFLDVPVFPVMRDLWHDHLLFEGDQLTGLIDFGAVRSESVACDLSRLLGSLFGDNQEQRTKSLDDYQSIRALTSNELRLIEPLDRSGTLLSCMTWLERRYFHPHRIKSLDRVCDRLVPLVERLQH
jgi:homoserine kinase type II